MCNSTDDEIWLLQVEQEIELLKQRVDALRMLIVDMVGREENTRHHSEIFYGLLCLIKALESARARLNF
jgi:hypothetical protein